MRGNKPFAIAAWLLLMAAIVPIVLGIWWLMWMLWTSVMPAMFPSSNPAWTDPSYWVFCGAWVIVLFLQQVVRKTFR